jgi:hypothetical protein
VKHRACLRCKARAAWWLTKGLAWGWAVTWLETGPRPRQPLLRLQLASLYWRCWYWPFYLENNYEIAECKHIDDRSMK